MVVVMTAVVYVKLRIDIVLFWRDTLGCYTDTSEEKLYDAYLMCYKSTTDGGLDEKERRMVREVLEEKFGYALCLYDRDVLPGEAMAEAVLGRIEQSRRLVLIPSSSDPDPGTGLLSGLHAALVERQTGLVLIQTESTQEKTPPTTAPLMDTDPSEASLDGLPEALRVLAQAGHTVTWKSPKSLSSSFWKQLRYHLPARQRRHRIRILPSPSGSYHYRAMTGEPFMMQCGSPTNGAITWLKVEEGRQDEKTCDGGGEGNRLDSEKGGTFQGNAIWFSITESRHSGNYTCCTG
ncbi:interleukin-18 receptor 1-like [Aplochiton taeniatus]